MMKKRRYIFTYLLSALLLASCAKEEVEQPGSVDEPIGFVTRPLRISVAPMQVPGGNAATRATDSELAIGLIYGDGDAQTRTGAEPLSEAECVYSSVYILQFAGTTPESKLLKKSENFAGKFDGSSYVSVDYTWVTNGQTQRVYVIANIPGLTLVENSTTLGEFEAHTYDFPVCRTPPADGLPMSESHDFNPSTTPSENFFLRLLVSKLTFKCDIKDVKYHPTIMLKNIPDKCAIHYPQITSQDAYRPSGITYQRKLDISSSKIEAVTVYLPPNYSGMNRDMPDKITERTESNTPAGGTFIEMIGDDDYYDLKICYLALGGEGYGPSYFNVGAGWHCKFTAQLRGWAKTDKRATIYKGLNYSAYKGCEFANCYIVSPDAGAYNFIAGVRGNNEDVEPPYGYGVQVPATPVPEHGGLLSLEPSSAEVLWETFNTDVAPKVGDVINGVRLYNDRVLFRTTEKVGNAAIAIYERNIPYPSWSWHIWVPNSEPAEIALTVCTADAGGSFVNGSTAIREVIMDRNLGALRAAIEPVNPPYGEIADYGLLYQWGRKDPFLAAVSSTGVLAKASVPFPEPKHVADIDAYAVSAIPTTFILYNDQNGDWLPETRRNSNLWGCPMITSGMLKIGGISYNPYIGSKTIYDPCPIGWKVMPSHTLAKAVDQRVSRWSVYGRTYPAGYSYDVPNSKDLFLAAAGYRLWDSNPTRLRNVGREGLYWTASSSVPSVVNMGGHTFMLHSIGEVLTGDVYWQRSNGASVRCTKEYNR